MTYTLQTCKTCGKDFQIEALEFLFNLDKEDYCKCKDCKKRRGDKE